MTLDGSKLADYGLDKPRDTVTVTYTDKTKAIIYVGDDAPQNAGTYIKFGSNDTVYLVAKDSVSAFDYGLTDLIVLQSTMRHPIMTTVRHRQLRFQV